MSQFAKHDPQQRWTPRAILRVMGNAPDRRPRDPNQLGKLMVDIMSGEVQDTISKQKKDPRGRGRMGGLKGGKARAESLSADERRRIAKDAAKARWGKRS